jgi:hypothetical protein
MGLVRPARLDEHVKRLAVAVGSFEWRLLLRVLQYDVEGLLVPELECRQHFADVLAGLAENSLYGFEGRKCEDDDLSGLVRNGGKKNIFESRIFFFYVRDDPWGLTVERLGVRMDTPVIIPIVPSEPMKSCLRS